MAEEAAINGNYYIAAKSYRDAAEIKNKITNDSEVDEKRDSALLYDQSSRMYHAINQFSEAAECIENAAKIYIRIGNKTLKRAANCYGLAKNYYGDSGDYDKCGEAYLNEMDCKRRYYLYLSKNASKNKFTNSLKYIKYEIFKWVTGYGEKLKNLLIFSILLVLLFTTIYYYLGSVQMPNNDSNSPFFIGSTKLDYLAACFKFSLSLFSGFSTTPYLLITYNWISTVEVITGNLVLAIFIAIILRKISRR